MDESVSSSGEEDLHTALQHITTATATSTIHPQLVGLGLELWLGRQGCLAYMYIVCDLSCPHTDLQSAPAPVRGQYTQCTILQYMYVCMYM